MMASVFLGLAMLAALVLIFAGARLVITSREERQRGWLMIGAALVTIANVAIWLWPMPGH